MKKIFKLFFIYLFNFYLFITLFRKIKYKYKSINLTYTLSEISQQLLLYCTNKTIINNKKTTNK